MLKVLGKPWEHFSQTVVFVVDYKHDFHAEKVAYSYSLDNDKIKYDAFPDFGTAQRRLCDLPKRLTSIQVFVFAMLVVFMVCSIWLFVSSAYALVRAATTNRLTLCSAGILAVS